jgi:archaellum component FlaF (FlaF/FlaG flagellin family)
VAFSTIASYMIFFFGILIMISSIVMVYSSMVESSNQAYNVQQQKLEGITHTIISITGISVDTSASPDEVRIEALSTGSNRLRPEYVDVYIDGTRIPRSTASRTIGFAENSSAISPLLWDPYETLQINVSLDIAPGEHIAYVTTEYGVTTSRTFFVS